MDKTNIKGNALFINSVYYTKSLLLKMNNALRKRWLLGGAYTIAAFYGLYGLNLLFKNNPRLGGVYLFLSLLLTAGSLIIPRYGAHIQYKRLLQIYPTEPKVISCFYENHFSQINEYSKAEQQFDYSRITRLSQSRDYYYLWIESRQVILLKKDTFTQGSPEEFAAFISSRALNAKNEL